MNYLFRIGIIFLFYVWNGTVSAQKFIYVEFNGFEEAQNLTLGLEKNKKQYNYSVFISGGNFGSQRYDSRGVLDSKIPYYGVLPGSDIPKAEAERKENCTGFSMGISGGFNWDFNLKNTLKFKFSGQYCHVYGKYSYLNPNYGKPEYVYKEYWHNNLSFQFAIQHYIKIRKWTFIYYGAKLPYFFALKTSKYDPELGTIMLGTRQLMLTVGVCIKLKK